MPKHAIEAKWVFGAILSWIVLAFGLAWSLWYIHLNSQYTLVGKAVDCNTQPPHRALSCNPRVDGLDCLNGSRNWLAEWHAPIAHACAQLGEDEVFVFSTYRDLQLDAETIHLMREILPPEEEKPIIQGYTE